MFYRVRSQPNPPHDGFRRGGRLFSASEWTYLSGAELSPDLLNEPMLIVEEISEEEFFSQGEPEPEDPRDAEIATLRERHDALLAEAQKSFAEQERRIDGLQREHQHNTEELVSLARQRDKAQAKVAELEAELETLRAQVAAQGEGEPETPATEPEAASEPAATEKPAGRRQGGGK
ncbi:MAG: hypothetical protein ACK47B_21800 [Armatimonadota bacterium]